MHRTDVDKFFTSLIAHNTQLKSLTVTSIEPVGERSELRTFLASQESLKSLNLSCKNLPFSVLLDYLRLNLKTLTRLIWTEDLPESGKRVPFSPFELEAIRDSCPDLDNLSMFLPVEDLDLVSSISAILQWRATAKAGSTSQNLRYSPFSNRFQISTTLPFIHTKKGLLERRDITFKIL